MTNRFEMSELERRVLLTQITGVVFADTVVKNNRYDSGEGVAGCVVTFNRNSDHQVYTPVTASDGTFTVDDMLPGVYSLNVDGPNVTRPYNNSAFTVTTEDEEIAVQVTTSKAPASTPPKLAVSVTTPGGTFIPGAKPLPVTVTVSNTGGAYAGPIAATVYLSTNKTIEDSDLHLPALSFPAISIGAHSTRSFTFNAASIADLLPLSNYYVLTKITTTTSLTAVAKAVTKVTPASTNLTATFQKTPVPNAKTKTLPFTLLLKNTGTTTAAGSVTLTVSARPTKGGPDISLTTLPSSHISVPITGKGTPLAKSISTSSLPAGSYRLIVTLTSSLSTPESKTTDNTATSAVFKIL